MVRMCKFIGLTPLLLSLLFKAVAYISPGFCTVRKKNFPFTMQEVISSNL